MGEWMSLLFTAVGTTAGVVGLLVTFIQRHVDESRWTRNSRRCYRKQPTCVVYCSSGFRPPSPLTSRAAPQRPTSWRLPGLGPGPWNFGEVGGGYGGYRNAVAQGQEKVRVVESPGAARRGHVPRSVSGLGPQRVVGYRPDP